MQKFILVDSGFPMTCIFRNWTRIQLLYFYLHALSGFAAKIFFSLLFNIRGNNGYGAMIWIFDTVLNIFIGIRPGLIQRTSAICSFQIPCINRVYESIFEKMPLQFRHITDFGKRRIPFYYGLGIFTDLASIQFRIRLFYHGREKTYHPVRKTQKMYQFVNQ